MGSLPLNDLRAEIGDFACKNLFVIQSQNADAVKFLKGRIALLVTLSVVVCTINFDNQVLLGQIEVDDAIVGFEKSVLVPIGKAERSEVGTEQVLGRCRLSSQLSGVDFVAFAERLPVKCLAHI